MSARPALVTGASGFIGSALLRRFAADGRAVALLTTAPRLDRARAAALAAGLEPTRTQVHTVEWQDATAVRKALGAIGTAELYHLAGERPVQQAGATLAEHLAANVRPLAALAAAWPDVPPMVVVLAGSAETYGACPAPFHEEQTPQPTTPYGIAKWAAESLADMAGAACGVPVIRARMTVVYGPGQPAHMFVAQAIAALAAGRRFDMTAGEQVRDLIYVEDAAEALIRLARCTEAGGLVVNVGSGESIPLRELGERIARALGAQDRLGIGARPYRPGEIMDYRVAIDRLSDLVGWRPCVPLDDGIARTVAAGTRR